MTDTDKLTVVDVFGTEEARKETLDLILHPGSTQLSFASQAELGKHLIQRALGKAATQFHDVVVSYVENIGAKLRQSVLTRDACEQNIAFYKAQIDAVEKGEFQVHPITGRIEFTDARLNETR